MTDEQREKKLATIRGLLAKAEATTHEEERDALNAKAFDLAERYGIDQAMLAAEAPGAPQVGDRVIKVDDPYARHKAHLLAGLGTDLRARTLIIQIRPRPKKLEFSVHLFGAEADLDLIELLYTSLLIQAARFMAAENPTDRFGRLIRRDQLSAYRRSWLEGFTFTVRSRMAKAARDSEREAAESGTVTSSGTSTELVLASRKEQIDRRFAEVYDQTEIKTMGVSSSGSGFGAGMAAGARADLGGKRVGRKAAGALSR